MRMMKWVHQMGFCMVLLSAVSDAGAVSNDAGTSWLRIPASTRSAAMGEALGAVADPVDGVVLNPAGLGLLDESNLAISQNFWAQDSSIQHFSFTRGSSEGVGLALGGEYVNFGEIPFYRVKGSSIVSNGNRSPFGLNLYGGAGKKLWKDLRGGVTAHFLYDNIYEGAEGKSWAVDVGFLYRTLDKPLSAPVALSDLGGKLDDVKLPTRLKTAVSYRFILGDQKEKIRDTLVIGAEGDLTLLKSSENAMGIGAEYTYQGFLALRGGYRLRDLEQVDGVKGLSFGFGLWIKNWRMDYALTTIGDFGTAHQIALSLRLK